MNMSDITTQDQFQDALEVAQEAGHVLLENGAEIARIEETMERISTHYGARSGSFFVLSNGIFTTGSDQNSNQRYAKVDFIPLRGAQMEKFVAINTLSREIEQGMHTLEEARTRIREIHDMPAKPVWEQLLGSAFGSAGFCVLFGGGLLDALAAFIVGLLLWAMIIPMGKLGISKVLVNLLGGAFASLLCYGLSLLGMGDNLANMMIGALIPLIPGVPFLNGITDLANEDYIAGITKLLDAVLVFIGIAAGVCTFFLMYSHISGSLIELHSPVSNPLTANLPAQAIAAMVGTVGFAVLFGLPRKEYLTSGIVATIGWALYFALDMHTAISVAENTFLTSCLVVWIARRTAVVRKCPTTIFMICGLFPLIPGAGIFWTTYFITSRQLPEALTSGMTAISVALVIVLGVIAINNLFPWKKKK